MEKGKEPPPDEFSNIPAPPYPGPPLDQSVPAYQPPAADAAPRPASQPVAQQYLPQYPQQYPPQHPQQYPQQYPQQHPQQHPQQYPQQHPQYPQTVHQVSYRYTAEQVVQPVNQVVVVQQLPTDVPGQMLCPHCQNNVVTKIDYKIGALTWIICAVLAAFLCWPCFLIPFCVNGCKDVEHSCPTCNKVLHIYKRR